MAKLTKKELSDWIDKIKNELPNVVIDEIVYGPKNIEVLRKWFDLMPGKQLSSQIIDDIIKKYNNWDIYKNISIHQFSLTTDQILRMYNKSHYNKSYLWFSMINKKKVDSVLKLEIVNDIFEKGNINHYRTLLGMMNNELMGNDNKVWSDAFDIMITYIKKEDKRAEYIASIYVEQDNFAYEAFEKGIESTLLYQVTGLEQYLSKEIKDVFLF